MIEKIKTYIIIGLAIALVGVTLFFTMGKGVIINKQTYMTTNQHQEQFQGQLIIQNWMAQGNKIVWKYKIYDTLLEANDDLNSMPPQYSLMSSKPFPINGKWAIWIPEFMVETKK